MYVHTVCIQYLQRPKNGVRVHGTEVGDGCEPLWELGMKLGPSGEQLVLLTRAISQAFYFLEFER